MTQPIGSEGRPLKRQRTDAPQCARRLFQTKELPTVLWEKIASYLPLEPSTLRLRQVCKEFYTMHLHCVGINFSVWSQLRGYTPRALKKVYAWHPLNKVVLCECLHWTAHKNRLSQLSITHLILKFDTCHIPLSLLAAFKQLTTLSIKSGSLDCLGDPRSVMWPNLIHLNLSKTIRNWQPVHTALLTSLTKLETLNISSTAANNAVIAALPDSLRLLNISGTSITDPSCLLHLKNLTHLIAFESSFTWEQLEEVKKELPHLKTIEFSEMAPTQPVAYF
jgi:hypothetical protein